MSIICQSSIRSHDMDQWIDLGYPFLFGLGTREEMVLDDHRIDTNMIRNMKSELLQNRHLQAYAFGQ